jgi:hypothetical protein
MNADRPGPDVSADIAQMRRPSSHEGPCRREESSDPYRLKSYDKARHSGTS